MVSNTDPQHRPGRHWIAIYISSDRQFGEYFDSFGRDAPPSFVRFMNDNCMYWTFNETHLQSIASNFCGYYCVYYCILGSRGISMARL